MRILVIAALAFFPGVAAARAGEAEQSPPAGNWALVEALSKDSPITTRLNSGDDIRGEFLALDAESIQLRFDGQDRRYRRTDVAEISQSRQGNRKRSALWGMLIGFGIGFPLGYFAAPVIGDNDEMPNGEQFAAGAFLGGIGAGIGGGLGALAGSPRKMVIYRAR